jgi:hypothetical protein
MVYEDRLKELGITSQETRRGVYAERINDEIMKGFETVEIDENTRGAGEEGRRHNKKIIKEKHVNTPMRDGF